MEHQQSTSSTLPGDDSANSVVAPDVAQDAPVLAHPPICSLSGALWILEDQSRVRLLLVGRVLASWDRTTLVSDVEHSHRGERFELSWPRQGALVRGVMPSGEAADLFAGHLVADQLTH